MRAAVEEAVAALPEPLACAGARRAVLELAEALPAIGEPFGFECRLSAGAHPVDFGFAVPSSAAGAALGAAVSGAPDAARARLAAFATRLASDASLRAWVPFLFLEYDAGAPLAPAPVPSLFAALDSPLSPRPGRAPELDAALEVIVALRGREAEPAIAVVRRAHALLPPGARLLHVGVLCGRADPSVRLSLLLEGAQAARYLDALGAPEAGAAAHAALAGFGPWLGAAQVDLDCGPPIGARVGIGLPPEASGALGEALVAHAGASRARVAALARWHEPPDPSRGVRARRVSHTKLVCAPDRVLEAKAYLEVAAAWT